MPAAPAIPLFGDSYLADTRHLRLEEHGAYLQLLMIAWRSDGCSLPNDDKRLAQMLGIPASRWTKLKPSVMSFWRLENGCWTQARLSKERKFVDEKRTKNKQAADHRWSNQTIENKEGDGCERITERSCERNAPPPTLKKEEESNPPKGGQRYAFEGRVIRLKPSDFERWKKSFSRLDLPALLQSRDDWLAEEADEKTRKRWFISTSNHLANLQQQTAAEDHQPMWDGMA